MKPGHSDTYGSTIAVENSELLTVREAMREMNRVVDQVESGQAEKFVLTAHGKMRAVVISVDKYSRLTARTKGERGE